MNLPAPQPAIETEDDDSSASERADLQPMNGLPKDLEARGSDAASIGTTTLDAEVIDTPPALEIRRQSLRSRIDHLEKEVLITVPQEGGKSLLRVLHDTRSQLQHAASDEEVRAAAATVIRTEKRILEYGSKSRHLILAGRVLILMGLSLLGFVAALTYWGSHPSGPSSSTIIPILDVPLPILLWSAIGSLIAMLHRFTSGGDTLVDHPQRWLFARPLVGMATAVSCYFVLRVGAAAFGTTADGASFLPQEVFWLVAFLAGLSDRLSAFVLNTVVGRYGERKAPASDAGEMALAED